MPDWPAPAQAEVIQLREQLDAERNTNEVMVDDLAESLADLELTLEDRGWQSITGRAQYEFTRAGLGRAADVARTYAIANPLIKRGLALRSAYVWGQGLSIGARAATDEGGSQDVNAVIQGFLDDPSNRTSLTSGQAHEELERSLGTDGNVFLAGFTSPLTGRVQVRSFPFREITEIITNPEDRDDPWFYLRSWQTTAVIVNGDRTQTANQLRRVYYPAMGFRPPTRPTTINGIPVQWDAPILHISVNRLDGWLFGIGDAYAALPWARMYQDFLVDWAKLVKALSRFAWRLSGDRSSRAQKAAARVKAVAASEADLTLPGRSPAGQVAAMGPGASLEAIPKSGATIDSNSGRPVAAMTAAALGVPVTMLLADPGQTGARAVAETLDRPTELEMEQRRDLWKQAHRTLTDYVIDQAVKAPLGGLRGTVTRDRDGREVVTLAGDVERTVDIAFPEMTQQDPEKLIAAIVAADSTETVPPLVTLRLLLQAMGVDDVDEILEDVTGPDGEFLAPTRSAAADTATAAAVEALRRGEDPAAVL
jgi:hypothetical protein